MNRVISTQPAVKVETRSQIQKNSLVWLRFLRSENSDIANHLALTSKSFEFQVSETVHSYRLPDSTQETVLGKQSSDDFYIVCRGRVRILSIETALNRSVSIRVLQESEAFGADDQFCPTPFPYQVVAASPVEVLQIPVAALLTWLEQLPQLRDYLQQRAGLNERLVFFKTLTGLKTLPSQVIQNLLPHLTEIAIPIGEQLEPRCRSDFFWLRQGAIGSPENSCILPAIGSSWGHPNSTPSGWVAETNLRLYKLSVDHWEMAAAIAPTVFTSLTSPPGANPNLARQLHLNPTATQRLQDYRQSLLPSTAKSSADVVSRTATPETSPQRHEATKDSAASLPFPQPKPRKQLRLWRDRPFIQQQSSSDCGVTCLAMIGQYWGKRLSLNSLRNLAEVGRSGASLKNLAKTAETIGFQARPVRASLSRLEDQNNPWIAHWEGDHYVVVYQTRGDRLLVSDPARGKRVLSRQKFMAHWTGYALILDPTSQLKAIDPKQSQSLWRFWSLLLPYRSVLWQVILISLLMQVFGLFTPLFTQVILDKVVVQKSQDMLLIFAIGLVIFSVWRIGLGGVRQYLLDYFSNRMDLTMVSGFISHTLRLPLKFFESRQVGDILTRIQENQKIQVFSSAASRFYLARCGDGDRLCSTDVLLQLAAGAVGNLLDSADRAADALCHPVLETVVAGNV